MRIYVSSLADMPRLVRDFGVGDLVSVIEPDAQPPTPPEVDPARHHRCAVHDIVESQQGSVLAGWEHIADLIAFLRTGDGRRPLLVHCHAGVSRSTAVALVAHVMQTGDPIASATALRKASFYAWPNLRIVALADAILGFDGALIDAREGMGRANWRTDADYRGRSGLPGYEPGRYTMLRV